MTHFVLERFYLHGFLNIIIPFVFAIVIFKLVYMRVFGSKFYDYSHYNRNHRYTFSCMGGVIILFCLVVSVLFSYFFHIFSFNLVLASYILVPMILLLLFGLLADYKTLAIEVVLSVQFVIVLVFVKLLDLKMRGLADWFGFEDVGDVMGYFGAISILFVFTNVLNYLERLDGLVAILSLLIFMFFGLVGFYVNDMVQVVVNFSFVGIILAFLYFELLSPFKFYLGRGGVYIIGFYMGYQVLLRLNGAHETLYFLTPTLFLAFFSYPILDAIRVFVLRFLKGISLADMKTLHIHHQLLAIGLSNSAVSAIVLLYTLGITLFFVFISTWSFVYQFFIGLFIGLFILYMSIFCLKPAETKT